MRKATIIFLLLLFCRSVISFSQCRSVPPPPDCNGTEPLVLDNETINKGSGKWYYGSTAVFNSLTLNGGTLVVCGDLTIDKFYMDSGTVYVRPGARFVIGSGIGAGLVLKGNSSIYNYGTCEVQRNLSLDNGYATAATPNIVINATSSAVFKMSNQYFVINNAYSWFVNNGSAEFWGIITDQQSSAGSVCLGQGSSTRMAVLINKIADSYRVPVASACLNVHQFSQFNNKLTNDPGLSVCLGSGHNSSSGCGGCPANNWGAAQVFTNCMGCGSLTVLGVQFTSLTALHRFDGGTRLSWQFAPVTKNAVFKIQRSADGKNYQTVDSFIVIDESASLFNTIDKTPASGNNYYMIKYINPVTGIATSSKSVKVFSENVNGFTMFPIPFGDKFFISDVNRAEQIILTDLAGRNILIRYLPKPGAKLIEIDVLDKILPGIYIIHIRTDKSVMAKTIFKE
jgi:hypothetical protein